MFNAIDDIVIQYFDRGRQVYELTAELTSLTARTHGLAERGHPEFELVDVAPSLNGEAAMLLNTAADAAMQRRPFEDGRLWASRLPGGYLVATQVVAAPSGALRLTDPGTHPDEPARMAICAVAVSRSRMMRQETEEDEADPELADAILEHAIAWFPGEPGEGLLIANDELCNQGNSLAYLEHSDHVQEPDTQDAFYRKALERSRSLRLREVGGPLPEPLERGELDAEVAMLVRSLQASALAMGEMQGMPDAPPAMAFLLSPVLRLGPDGLEQSLAIGPPEFRSYFFDGEIAERLASRAVHELVAEIHRRSVTDPVDALVLSRETTRGVYESGYRFDDQIPARPFSLESVPGSLDSFPFVSRLLAALGRELAAGLSLDEVRARWGLVDAPALAKSAASKLDALRSREDSLLLSAYGGG